MYNKSDVLRFVKQGESATLAFFDNLKLKELSRTIVAMANTYGGIILMGVKPGGEITGVEGNAKNICSRILERVEEVVSPRLKFEVYPVKLNGKVNILLNVPMAGADAFYTCSGISLIREDNKNIEISRNEMYLFSIKREPVKFELLIDKRARLSDINFEMVEKFRKKMEERIDLKITAPALNILETGGFVVNDRVKMTLNNGAILAFSKTPQKFIPYSYISCIDFRTYDNILRKDFYGNLFDLIDNTFDFIMERLSDIDNCAPSFFLDIADGELEEKFTFMIKELLINAVSHRDYSVYGDRIYICIFEDRLEIINPGGIIHSWCEDICTKRLRNPLIHNLLSEYYFDQNFLPGIGGIKDTCDLLSIKMPEFLYCGSSFKALLWMIREEGGDICPTELSRETVEIIPSHSPSLLEKEIIEEVISEQKKEEKEEPHTSVKAVLSVNAEPDPAEYSEVLADEQEISSVKKFPEKDKEKNSLTSKAPEVKKTKKSRNARREEAVILYLKEYSEITRTQCEELLKIEPRTANRLLKAMVEKNILCKKGSGTNFYYVIA